VRAAGQSLRSRSWKGVRVRAAGRSLRSRSWLLEACDSRENSLRARSWVKPAFRAAGCWVNLEDLVVANDLTCVMLVKINYEELAEKLT